MPDLKTPTDPDALLTDLSDPAKVAELLADGGEKLGALVKNYAAEIAKRDTTIAEQTRDQVSAIVREWLIENEAELIGKAKIEDFRPGMPTNKAVGHSKRAVGAQLDSMFDASSLAEQGADFFQSWWATTGNVRLQDAAERRERMAKVTEIQNSFGSVVPADGGFLIPENLRAGLLQVALESAVVRPRATVIPMDSLRVPMPALDVTTNATSILGGIIGYWTEESAALTESQATFARVVLEAKKLTTYGVAPNELMADAAAFGAFFASSFPKAIAWYEDVAFMKGSGVGEPLGWLSSGNNALASVAAETAQASATITYENVIKMYARMLPSSLASAVWVCDIQALPQLATMGLSVGTGGAPIWINNGVEGPPLNLLGRPVILTEKANTLGSVGDINFVDLSYYLVGDRMAMTAMASEHFRFQNDQIAFRVIERVDGRPWIQNAITPQNGGATLTPFVQLAARP